MNMLVDSHCHLDFPELASHIRELLAAMQEKQVGWALCAGVTLERFPGMLSMVRATPNLYAAVGVHPDTEAPAQEADLETLLTLANDPKVVAIGETGLDYYRLPENSSLQKSIQQTRFRTHIQAARQTGKPLIIHTRSAADDTLRILREEDAGAVGGVFHCFTETAEIARQALDLGFHISFSGILTFKNAVELKNIARWVPLERLLVETDSPYLAPVPYRGKINQPAYVRHVAEEIARLRELPLETVVKATTDNFFRLFSYANP